VTMKWISSHDGITGNEAANLEASQAISGELVDGRPPIAHGFLPNARRVMFQDTSSKLLPEFPVFHKNGHRKSIKIDVSEVSMATFLYLYEK
jgi:hypothetical protein